MMVVAVVLCPLAGNCSCAHGDGDGVGSYYVIVSYSSLHLLGSFSL